MRSASLAVALAALSLAASLPAQRGGGRGRPEAIQERVGCFFADATATAPQEGAEVWTGIAGLQAAAEKKEMVLVYLCDAEPKREQYEQTLFNFDEVGVALRCFRCLKVDLGAWPEGAARYGQKAPVFLAFGPDGKLAGELSQAGYKAAVNPVIKLLEKAAQGHLKPALPAFVKGYRDVVQGLEQVERDRKTLQDRLGKLDDKDAAKKADLEKDLKQLDQEEQKLLDQEKGLLEKAKVQARDPAAKRIGQRPGRGR